VQSLETGERKILVSGGSDARYVSTGHLVYALGNVLHAKVFNADSLEVQGGAVPIVEAVGRAWITGSANYGFSDTGMLAHLVGRGETTQRRRLVWVDRSGTESPLSAEPRAYVYPRISPDGKRVALDVRDQENDIWIWDLVREKITRFTLDAAGDQYPFWSPDGNQIAFNSPRTDGVFQIYRKASNNPTSTVELLTESLNIKNEINGYFFTPDNQFMVYREQGSAKKGDNIGMIFLNDNSDVKWLLNEEFNERNAELSPDGNWIAYQSDQSGQYEIYVRPFPNVNERSIQISNGGGRWPLWSRNDSELFYVTSGNPPHMVAVSIETNPEFDFESPEELFEWHYFSFIGRTYDVSLDGQRFLVIDPTPADQGGTESAPRINIIANWFEELKNKAPVDQ
jgi:serine/threonine-protein kinase